MSKKATQEIRLPEGLEDDLRQYTELNPAYNLLSDDERIVKLREFMLAELDEIFYQIERDERGEVTNLTPRSPRSVSRLLGIYQVELKARVQGLLGNDLWAQKGPATPEEFRASSRTQIKTFEEVVSPPAEIMAFDRDEPEIANGEALAHFNISPKEITDTLLRNLGLSQYIVKKGQKMSAKDRMALKVSAIPDVREKLGKLEPIQRSNEADRSDLKYFRLMRMTEGETEGAILGTQMIGDNKILFRTTLDGAERRLLNIEVGYEEEIKGLKFIESVLHNVQTNLDQWKQLTHAEISSIKTSLLQCVENLEHVQNEHKKELKRHIRGCLSLKDIKNRNNPGAIMAKLNAALPFVGERLKEIGEIWRYIGNDKARVQELRAEEKKPLVNFCTEVEALHQEFKILKPNDGALMDEGKKAHVIRNLDARKVEAAKLRFEPYLSFGRKFILQIDIVIAALNANDFENAAREFVKLYLITKIDRAYEEMSAIHLKVSAYHHLIQPEGLQAEIERKREAFGKKPVASEIEIEEYRDAYDEVYHLYNSLCARLRELLSPQLEAASAAATDLPPQKKSNRLDDIINSLQGVLPDRLNDFVDRLRARVNTFMFRISGKVQPGISRMPQADVADAVSTKAKAPSYSQEAAEETYGKIKARIQEFPFAELVRNLPDTPTPATHATAAS